MANQEHVEEDKLPDEAFVDLGPSTPKEINSEWLAKAPSGQAISAMVTWFLIRHFEAHPDWSDDPGLLDSVVDPSYVLHYGFGDSAKGADIEAAVRQIQDAGGPWFSVGVGQHDEDDYDFEVEPAEADLPLLALRTRLGQLQGISSLSGEEATKSFATMLAFSGVIGALEAFLWETVAFSVANDEEVLGRFITELAHFANQPMVLGDIYKRLNGLREDVKKYLGGVVWHNWGHVRPMLVCMGVRVPKLTSLQEAVQKRHHIVHRSGLDPDGGLVTVSEADVHELCAIALAFAEDIARQLFEKRVLAGFEHVS